MQYILLCLLMFVHYICDYSHLSTSTMLSAKRTGSPLLPIFAHALVHAVFMLIVLFFFNLSYLMLVCLFAIELITHFIIDVLKGKMNVWFPNVASPANKSHWYIFGFDQLLHHLVIVLISYLALK